jgi:hypothetical protein
MNRLCFSASRIQRTPCQKARKAAEEALRIDPDLAEAHSSAGFVKLTYDWDWEGARAEFKGVGT